MRYCYLWKEQNGYTYTVNTKKSDFVNRVLRGSTWTFHLMAVSRIKLTGVTVQENLSVKRHLNYTPCFKKTVPVLFCE